MKIKTLAGLLLMLGCILFFGCKKSNAVSAAPADISELSGVWICPHWINPGDTLEFTFNTTAKNAVDSYMNPQNYGYTAGDIVLSGITTTSTANTFTCTAEVRSGNNNSVLSNGTIRLILLNNMLTAKYSDISGYADLTFTKK